MINIDLFPSGPSVFFDVATEDEKACGRLRTSRDQIPFLALPRKIFLPLLSLSLFAHTHTLSSFTHTRTLTLNCAPIRTISFLVHTFPTSTLTHSHLNPHTLPLKFECVCSASCFHLPAHGWVSNVRKNYSMNEI